jgi:hypothetical protein
MNHRVYLFLKPRHCRLFCYALLWSWFFATPGSRAPDNAVELRLNEVYSRLRHTLTALVIPAKPNITEESGYIPRGSDLLDLPREFTERRSFLASWTILPSPTRDLAPLARPPGGIALLYIPVEPRGARG